MKLVFIDAEYTGEHAYTTLVSLGLVTLEGDALDLRLNDYDRAQVTQWLADNVLALIDPTTTVSSREAYVILSRWLADYAGGERLHLVSAGLGSDLLLLFELYKHARPDLRYFHALECLPPHLNHAEHFDLNTLMFVAGADPDADRERLVSTVPGERHDALHDARLARDCFLAILQSPALNAFGSLRDR